MQLPAIPPGGQREMIGAAKMLRAEDFTVAAHVMLYQTRGTAISLMRVERRIVDRGAWEWRSQPLFPYRA